MEFDIKTIFSLLILVKFLILIVLILFKYLNKIRSNNINYIILGTFLSALGYFFHSVARGKIPETTVLILANIPILYGIAFEAYSYCTFGQEFQKKKLIIFLGFATLFSAIFLFNIHASLHTRIIIASFALSLIYLVAGFDLIFKKQSQIKVYTGYLFLLASLINICRVIVAYYSGDNIQLFNGLFFVLLIILYYIVTFILSINYFFLIKEDDDIKLVRTNKLLDNILSGIPDSIHVYSPEKEVLFSNTKENNDRLKVNESLKCYHLYGNQSKCNWCEIDKVNDNKSFHEHEKYFQKSDKYFNIKHIKLDDGNILNIIRDITSLKKSIQLAKMLSEIVEQSPSSIVVTDLDGKIEFVNKKFAAVTGYEYNEVIGQKPSILKSSTSHDQKYDDLWNTITKGKVWQGEFKNKKKNGEFYYESATISPFFNEKAEITKYFSIKNDITKEKEAQNLLVESEARYRTLFENVNDPVTIISGATFINCNQAAIDAIKVNSKDDFLSLKPWEISPEYQPDGRTSKKKAQEMIDKALESGYNQFDWIHKNILGETNWYNVSLTKIIIDGKTVLHTVWRDINKRKLQEEELKILALKLSRSQSIGSVGYFEWYKDTDLVTGSDEYFRIWETNPENHNCFNDFIITVHPDDRENVHLALSNAIENKLYYDVEYRINLKNNICKNIHAKGEFNFDEKGNAYYLLGMVHDITKLKLAEHKIKTQNAKLKKLNANKNKFFSIVAHDIKGPLGSTKGLINILNEKLSKYNDAEKSSFISLINSSINSTYQLIENLLTWSRSQLDKISYHKEKTKLVDLVNESVSYLKSTIDNKDITLEYDIDDSFIVLADKPTVDTVIRNLLSNAIKYSHRSGSVFIDAFMHNNGQNNMVEICIKDYGVGMSKSIVKNIFSIERNVSEPGTENEGGTGLGLIVCKDFIENNSGKIWVESQKGKGTIFRFTLPIYIKD